MKRQTVFTRATLVAGIVVFAVLMAMRTEVATGWGRALLAGSAFAILAMVLTHARNRSW